MSLTIGRVSITDAPSLLDNDGHRLALGGWFTGSTLNNAKVLRQQLLGLFNNPDEPVVPFTSTDDSSLDGFYRVASVRVTPILGVSYERFKFQYAVDLERIGGFDRPAIELLVLSAIRQNQYTWRASNGGAGTGDYLRNYVFVPSSYTERSTAATASGRTGSDATTFDYYGDVRDDTDTNRSVYMLGCPAGDYYDGACLIEQSFSGTYYTVNGLDPLPGFVSAWRISNTLVRVELSSNDISVAHYDGSQWETAKAYDVAPASGSISSISAARILRNAPEECSVMVTGVLSTGESFTMTYSLNRGDRHVIVTLWKTSSGSWTLTLNPNEAGAVLEADAGEDYGIAANADDAAGNKYVMTAIGTGTAAAPSFNAANGAATSAVVAGTGAANGGSSYLTVFGIGSAIGGSGATGINTPNAIGGATFGAASVRQRVVVR